MSQSYRSIQAGVLRPMSMSGVLGDAAQSRPGSDPRCGSRGTRSGRWVEGHLTRNFRKLELDSRDERQAILGDASPVAS
jgi:hypothetical protein